MYLYTYLEIIIIIIIEESSAFGCSVKLRLYYDYVIYLHSTTLLRGTKTLISLASSSSSSSSRPPHPFQIFA